MRQSKRQSKSKSQGEREEEAGGEGERLAAGTAWGNATMQRGLPCVIGRQPGAGVSATPQQQRRRRRQQV